MSYPHGAQSWFIGNEAIHTCWDNALPPRLAVAAGDTVIFATRDPSWGQVARDVAAAAPPGADPELAAFVASQAYPPPVKGPGTTLRGHALTGPVAIAGAEPGDTLVVEVLEVIPAGWGWTACGPGEGGGLLQDELSAWTLHLWDLRDGRSALFAPGIRVPLAPFCGVMGVAPAQPGEHPTVPPGRGGGNMDIRQLTAGATLYLPVQTRGALFSVGDAHGAQGDGEVGGTGIETDATVTLRFGLLKDRALTTPRFATPSLGRLNGPWYAATGHAPDLYQAARGALRGVLDYLGEQHGLDRGQACILASACVDLRISQIVNGGVHTVSAFLPLAIFQPEG